MIDLNNPDFGVRKYPDPDEILKYINDLSIFNYYIKDLKINTAFKSPLREDKNPSFGVFYSKQTNMFLYKDLATGDKGDCFSFVKKLYPELNFNEVLQKICLDFSLDEIFYCGDNKFASPIVKPNIIYDTEEYKNGSKILRIKIKRDKNNMICWDEHDIAFWSSYGVNIPTLNLYNVVPVTHIFIYDPNNNKESILIANKYAYAYIEYKDNIVSYKIYQPYSKVKWLSSHSYSVHQGYTQLPPTNGLLIITKSLKDVMSLRNVANISSIAVQSENIIIKDTVMDEYKRRFNKVLCLFDNDKAGINLSNRYKETYNTDSISISLQEFDNKIKDFSDLVKIKTPEFAKQYINNLINNT